jgi:hypothetical protein
MSLPTTPDPIVDWRGVRDLVGAIILEDSAENFMTGAVFSIAGVATIEKTRESSAEVKFYNDRGAIITRSEGTEQITATVSAIPLSVYATITGQHYDEATGALIEGQCNRPYMCVGYKAKNSANEDVYVWRYKCVPDVPGFTHQTRDNSTTSNGQQIIFTGIQTAHMFSKNGAGSTGVYVPAAKIGNAATFFDTVTTPDDLVPIPSYTLTITQAAGTTLTVTRNGVPMTTGANIAAGDWLYITVSGEGATVRVNGTAVASGSVYVVTGNTVVASQAG